MYPGQTPATYPNGNFGYINRDLKQKYPHLKTLISVGGWSWSGQFSVVARDMNSRKVFSDSCAEFIDKYGFDGVDIDWEFPGGDGLPGNVTDPSDGRNYTLLLQEIRNSLNALTARTRKSYLLTIASGANPRVIDRLEAGPVGFVLDFMNVMTYDYRGAWSRGTGHHTPLYPVVGDPFDDGFGSTFSAIQKYIENGFPHQKICLGAAFYGRGFQGVPNQNNGLFQTFTSIPQGTWENGVFDYKDLITRSGYTDHWDNNAKAPWRYSERTEIFISYDNVRSITEKSWFVNANKLGGVMFWELSGDRNNELLSTISGVLDSGEISPDSRPKLSLPTDPEDPADIIVQPPPTGIMLSAYFTYWSASNGYSPADIPMSQLTHLFYAYARINADGSLSAGDDFTDLVRPYDGTTGAYLYLNKVLKPNYPDLKILLSIGGYSGSQHFPSAFRNVSNFTASCLDFIDRYGFDGVDICWEWPGLQGSTSGNIANDMRLYADAVNALRKAFNERNSGLLISVSAPSKKALVDALNYSTIVKPANFVNVKTFDYVSGASTKTGYLAPMYPSNFSEGSVKETIDTYVGREIPKKKVVLGVPFYGRSWINVPKGDNKGLGQTVTEQNLPPAADVPGGHLQELGLYPYHHIKKLLNQKKLGKNFDKTTVAEWAFCSTDGHFITFDSRCSLDAKASYVTTQNLGGIFAWEISGDSKDLDLIYGLNASLISGSCDYEGCGGGSSSPPPTPTPTPDPPGDSKFSKPIMGYYNALTGQAPINYTIDKVPADKISHLVYGPVTVSNGRVAWANVSRDAANMNIVNTQLKTKNRSLAVVVALGDNNFVNFMRTANAASLRTLAVSAKEFVETNGLQGLLVEYRWPTNATEGQNLTTLCRELRTAMSSLSPAPVLGCHIPWVSAFSTMPTPSVFMNAKEISDNVDFVSVQSYDFVAPGSPSSTYRMTGHNSNIEINMSSDPLRFASIAVTYKAYSDQGVPANKMVIGIPLFGRAFDGVPVAWQNGLFLVYSILPDGDPGYGTNVVTQTTIKNMITTRNFKTFFDDKAGASYCFGPSTSMPNFGYFITHEDTRSVTAKCDLIKSLNLFGSALWDLSADDSEGTITGAVASHFSTA
jgi:GH18 family chitinase